jgi:hypothetical protein
MPDQSALLRRALFSWGLRVLCTVDGICLALNFLIGSSMINRVVDCSLIWGPPIGFVAISSFSAPRLIFYMVYHAAAVMSIAITGVSPRGVMFSCFHLWVLSLVIRFYRMLLSLNESDKRALQDVLQRQAAFNMLLVQRRSGV